MKNSRFWFVCVEILAKLISNILVLEGLQNGLEISWESTWKMMEKLKFKGRKMQFSQVSSLTNYKLWYILLQAQLTRRWYITSFRLSLVEVRSIAPWPDLIYIMHYPVTLTLWSDEQLTSLYWTRNFSLKNSSSSQFSSISNEIVGIE